MSRWKWQLSKASQDVFIAFGDAVLRMHQAQRDGESGAFAVEMGRAAELLGKLQDLEARRIEERGFLNSKRLADERLWDETLRSRRHTALEGRRGN